MRVTELCTSRQVAPCVLHNQRDIKNQDNPENLGQGSVREDLGKERLMDHKVSFLQSNLVDCFHPE